jgi:zinc protease
METMLQLTYLSFTAPRMDMDAFESFKNRTKAELANQEANPMTALSDSLQHALYGNHPLAMRIKADMVDLIDYNRIMEMYKNRFMDAGDFTFLFVGNINPDEAKPMIETYLGGLPTIQRKENFADIKMDFRKGEYKNVFNKQMETPMATVVVVASGNCEYSLKNDLLMTCLSRTLDMVYLEEVREKQGGTYGVQTVGQLTRYPKDEAILQVVFNTDPTKREMLMQIIMSELQKVAKEGPKEEHLAKVKEAMVKQYAENIKENNYWLGQLYQYYWYNEDMNINYEQVVNSITVKDVQEFAKKLFDQGNLIEVSMTAETTK